jgi:hypothetical protein
MRWQQNGTRQNWKLGSHLFHWRIQKWGCTQCWPYLGGEPVTSGSTVDDPLVIATERGTAYGPAKTKTQAPPPWIRIQGATKDHRVPTKRLIKERNGCGRFCLPLSDDMNLRRHNVVNKRADGVSSRNRASGGVAGQRFRRLRSDRAWRVATVAVLPHQMPAHFQGRMRLRGRKHTNDRKMSRSS